MELMVKIEELCYADVAAVALPMLGKAFSNRSGAVAMAAETAAGLPEPLVRQILEQITDQRLSELLCAFVMENKDKVLQAINRLAAENAIGVKAADLVLTPRMEVRVRIGELDYACVIRRFLPMVKEALLAMGGPVALLRPVIRNATAETVYGLLDRLLADKKDAFLVSMINQYSGKLMGVIEDMALRQKIHVKIGAIQAIESA